LHERNTSEDILEELKFETIHKHVSLVYEVKFLHKESQYRLKLCDFVQLRFKKLSVRIFRISLRHVTYIRDLENFQ